MPVDDAREWAGAELDDQPKYFEVYAENWQAAKVFESMATQWQWTGGMESCRSGLNHGVLYMHADKFGVKRRDRVDVFNCVQVMEHAALEVWCAARASRKQP